MQTRKRITATVCLLCMLAQVAAQPAGAQATIMPAVEPATRVYRAGKNPDPAMAREVAMALGTGRHVVTRLHTGKTYRGHIEAIDERQFSIRLDHNKGALTIPYADVVYLEQNLTKAAKILIGIGVGVGVVLAALVIWAEVCCE
jgi:hypothetical protein